MLISKQAYLKGVPFSWKMVYKWVWRPGGTLGYHLGGYVPPGRPNWHPVLKKNSPKIDTPFSDLEMGQFFIPRSRIRPKTDTPF